MVRKVNTKTMNIIISPKLADYMAQKEKHHISVEVVSSTSSDFEVTEIYYRLVDEKTAAALIRNKHCRAVRTGDAEVLFPPYRLELSETVLFDIRTFWIFHKITAEGIRL